MADCTNESLAATYIANCGTVMPVLLQMQEKRQRELWMMIRVSDVIELTPSLCKPCAYSVNGCP